jgi:hypothetical protein
MRMLLRAMSPVELHECLTEVDAYGQTLLHAASGAKASGIARRLLLDGGRDDVTTLAAVGKAIGVAIPLPPAQALSVRALNEALGVEDMQLLVEAAATAAPPLRGVGSTAPTNDPCPLSPRRRGPAADARAQPSGGAATWLDARDHRGRSALHLACRAGRANAVAALLRVGAAPMAAEEEWGGTCGHLAAARGHRDAVRAWAAAVAGGEQAAMAAADAFGRSVASLLCWHDGSTLPGWGSVQQLSAEEQGDGAAPREAGRGAGGGGNAAASCAASTTVGGAADGWRRPAPRELQGMDAPAASFARRPSAAVAVVEASALSRAEFVRRFESLGLPVLLRNASHSWPALAGPRAWRRERLMDAAGAARVAASAMPYQPEQRGAGGRTLAAFLDAMREEEEWEEGGEAGTAPANRSAPRPLVFSNELLVGSELGGDVGASRPRFCPPS